MCGAVTELLQIPITGKPVNSNNYPRMNVTSS